MISLISSTNRSGSNTLKIAKHYAQLLENEGASYQLIDFTKLPREIAFSELYGERSTGYEQDVLEIVEKSEKYVFIIPEYNGGFPGILKLFIDSCPPKHFHNKKAGLVGLSSGAAGALRPMDQFSNVLNYLKVDVMSQKPKLSGIDQLLNEKGVLHDERALAQLEEHAQRLVKF